MRRPLKPIVLLCGWIAGCLGLAQAADTPAAELTGPAKVYAAKCVMCHGKDYKGSPQMAKMFKIELSDLDLHRIQAKKDDELSTIILQGKDKKMPAFDKKLKPEEITAMIAYLRAQTADKKP